MGFMNTWYKWSRKYNEFLLKYNYGLLSGIFIVAYMKITTDISWTLAIGLGVIVAITMYLLLKYKVWANKKGEEYTANPSENLEDIRMEKSTNTIVALAKQTHNGVSTEVLVTEAKKRDISESRIKTAIWFQKHNLLFNILSIICIVILFKYI